MRSREPPYSRPSSSEWCCDAPAVAAELALLDSRVREHTEVVEWLGELPTRVGPSALDSRAASFVEHPIWLAAEHGDGDPRALVTQLRAFGPDDARPSEFARLGDLLWARGQSVAIEFDGRVLRG